MIDNTPETMFLLEISSIVQTCPLRQLSAYNPHVSYGLWMSSLSVNCWRVSLNIKVLKIPKLSYDFWMS
jgi:hypothetical protein